MIINYKWHHVIRDAFITSKCGGRHLESRFSILLALKVNSLRFTKCKSVLSTCVTCKQNYNAITVVVLYLTGQILYNCAFPLGD